MYTAVKTHVQKKKDANSINTDHKKNFDKKYGLPVIIWNLNHLT